jgi:hypothetical protein
MPTFCSESIPYNSRRHYLRGDKLKAISYKIMGSGCRR